MASTRLKTLLQERHWQKYETFCKEYGRAAAKVDAGLVGAWPSRAQLSRWLAGAVRRPHPDHCRVLEALLPGWTADQLFAILEKSDDASSTPSSVGDSETGQGETSLRQSGRHQVPSLQGRSAADWGATVEGALGEEVAVSTDESAKFVRQPLGAVNSDTIAQLDSDVSDIAIKYLTQPPYVTFIPLSRLRHDVFVLLDQRQRPGVLTELYRIAGQLCVLLAHASLDLGHAYAAETHSRTAGLCADMAGDGQLWSYIRWVQSNIAYWKGQFGRAAELAQSGHRLATNGTGRLRLASQELRAFAAAGDHSSVIAALRSVSEAKNAADESEDKPGGIFSFGLGKATYYESEARLALGGQDNAKLAASAALEALKIFEEQSYEGSCAEFVAAAQLDAALAYTALGKLDAVEQQMAPVFSLAVENRTLPIAQRIGKVGVALIEPIFAHSPIAAALIERVDLFSAYTAVRELPTA